MKTVKIVLTLLVAITLSCNGQANRTAMKNDKELELIKAPVSIGSGTGSVPNRLISYFHRFRFCNRNFRYTFQ